MFVVAETEELMWSIFLAYGTPLTVVPSFKYLGHNISSTDDKCQAVESNLQRSWGKWGKMIEILGREGGNKRMAVKLYVEVVQAVLLFGS